MSRAAAHLRTLSCLGLPPEAALVELAPLLREIVPADHVRIGLLDENDMPIMGYAEHPDFIALFFKTFDWVLSDPTSPAHIFMETHRRQRVGGMVGRQNAAYFETAYHQEFERQLDSHWLLEGAIPHGRRNVGSFNLTRRRLAKPFTAEDVRALERIQPWLSHALAPRAARVIANESSTSTFAMTPHLRASLILDWDLRCLHRTDNAEQLLYLLDHTTDNWRTQPRRDGVLPGIVRRVAASLRISAHADAEETAPPLRRRDTAWGRVVVEASWLRPDLNLDPACCAQAAPAGHLILVQLELRRHARAHAASVLRRAGATPLQVQVGIEILSGVSKADIADRLGVKRSTVEDASRKVYARVGVHSAADLATLCWRE
jgi:DNA-binding CsgD family transcriptional regulator